MKNINKAQLLELMRKVSSQIREGKKVEVEGFEYYGNNILRNENLRFEGNIEREIEEVFNDEFLDYFIPGGIQLEYIPREKEIYGSVLVKVEVEEGYIPEIVRVAIY